MPTPPAVHASLGQRVTSQTFADGGVAGIRHSYAAARTGLSSRLSLCLQRIICHVQYCRSLSDIRALWCCFGFLDAWHIAMAYSNDWPAMASQPLFSVYIDVQAVLLCQVTA